MSAVKDKQGNTYTDKKEVLIPWEEHFSAHLKTAFPDQPTAIDVKPAPEAAGDLPPISLEEIEQLLTK